MEEYIKKRDEAKFSVWVGGVEVNGHYLTERAALALRLEYLLAGYKDVVIRKEI